MVGIFGINWKPGLEDVGGVDGKSAGFFALEDTVDIGRRPSELVVLIEAVGNKPAVIRKHAQRIDRRQAMARGESDDLSAMHRREGIKRNDDPAAALASERFDRGCDLLAAAHRAIDQKNADRHGVHLDVLNNVTRSGAQKHIRDVEDTCSFRTHFAQKLEALPGHRELIAGEAGDIAIRPGEVRHNLLRTCVADNDEHQRDGRGRLPRRGHGHPL
jgi:hypothetical protein